MLNLIAIDPGNIESAYVVMDKDYNILHKAKVENHCLLHYLKCDDFENMAIEQIRSYGMSVGQTTFDTCEWTGRFVQQYIEYNCHGLYDYGYTTLFHVPRKDIKMHLCHSMKANDSNIRQALIDRYGAPGTKKNQGKTYGVSKDMWSALAVGTYALDTLLHKA